MVPVSSPLGPFDSIAAQLLLDDRYYVGKFITDHATGVTNFLTAVNVIDGEFVGEISDPWLARWDGDRLVLESR